MKPFSALAAITLMAVPAQATMGAKPNLLMEKLYYAEGRQHPDHPLHGFFWPMLRYRQLKYSIT